MSSRTQTVPEQSEQDERPGAVWQWPIRRGWLSRGVLFLTVAASYAAGSRFAILLLETSDLQGVLFVPAGITVAFLLRSPRQVWWIVLVAAGTTEFLMDLGGGFTASQPLGFATANVAEPFVGATVVTIGAKAVDLARRRDLLWFFIGAVVLGTAVGAAIGASADRVFGGDDFVATFLQWWLGDALGVVIVGTGILAWGSSPDRRSVLSPSGISMIAIAVAISVAVFGLSDLPLVFSVLVALMIAGTLFGVRAVAVMAIATGIAIVATLSSDPGELIVGMSRTQALLLIKFEIGIFTLIGLLVAAEAHERDLATRHAARSMVEAETREKSRLRDRELAVRIQRGLLPDRLVSQPCIDIAARYEAASELLEVGGDWYDTIQLSNGRVGLVVGDIVGHGIDAATSMGRLRTALAALAIHIEEPAALLRAVDDFVGGPDGTSYATLLYAVADPERGILTYASAGHPPGLLIHEDGSTVWLDQGQTGPLYGGGPERRQSTTPLEAGSTLVMYSDGLVEKRGIALESGLQILESHVAELADRRPELICESLFEEFSDVTGRSDDVVILVTRFGMDEYEYHGTFPARPESLRSIREELKAWSRRRDLPETAYEDLALSVTEAASNVVRHAYKTKIGGEVDVRVTAVDSVLQVEISDTGAWLEPGEERSTPGLGIGIMEGITDDFSLDKTGRGTLVTFRLPVHHDAGNRGNVPRTGEPGV